MQSARPVQKGQKAGANLANRGVQRLCHGAASISIALQREAVPMIGESNGVGICSGISCVRAGGVYRLVDVSNEKETETSAARDSRARRGQRKQTLVQHAWNRQRELRYHRVEPGVESNNSENSSAILILQCESWSAMVYTNYP